MLNAPPWLGYREKPFTAGFDFGKNPPTIKSIVISYAKNLPAYVFPPLEVEVWGGKNLQEIRLIKIFKPIQPTANQPLQIEALTIPLPNAQYSFYKLIARPVAKLPTWHGGKGKKGWVMVDEVLFN